MELLPGGKKEKENPCYAQIYTNAMMRALERLVKEPDNRQAKLQLVFYGVKLVNATDKRNQSPEGAANVFALISSINGYAEEITPRELMQVFPVSKVYDGEKWETKDYFYTMDVLQKHGLDKPMGEDAMEILFDYTNIHITMFAVATMSAISAMRRYNGEKGLLEEFAEQQGMKLQTYTMSKDNKGRNWLTDNDTGERQRVKVKRPRYLRAI